MPPAARVRRAPLQPQRHAGRSSPSTSRLLAAVMSAKMDLPRAHPRPADRSRSRSQPQAAAADPTSRNRRSPTVRPSRAARFHRRRSIRIVTAHSLRRSGRPRSLARIGVVGTDPFPDADPLPHRSDSAPQLARRPRSGAQAALPAVEDRSARKKRSLQAQADDRRARPGDRGRAGRPRPTAPSSTAARRHLIAHWRYKPASEDGRAVASSTVITLRFQLDG